MAVYKPTLQTVTLGVVGALGGGLLAMAIGRSDWLRWSLVGTVTLPTLEVLGKMVKAVISSRRANATATQEVTEVERASPELIGEVDTLMKQLPMNNAKVRDKALAHNAVLEHRKYPKEATELFKQTLQIQVEAWKRPEGESRKCSVTVGTCWNSTDFFMPSAATAIEGKTRILKAWGYDDEPSAYKFLIGEMRRVSDDATIFDPTRPVEVVQLYVGISLGQAPYAESRAALKK
jgi:hypothetical protein